MTASLLASSTGTRRLPDIGAGQVFVDQKPRLKVHSVGSTRPLTDVQSQGTVTRAYPL